MIDWSGGQTKSRINGRLGTVVLLGTDDRSLNNELFSGRRDTIFGRRRAHLPLPRSFVRFAIELNHPHLLSPPSPTRRTAFFAAS